MSESEDYVVERLVKIKKISATKKFCGIQVFIKWKDYPETQNTWEPIENLNPDSAIEMLDELSEDIKGGAQKNYIKQAITFFENCRDDESESSSDDDSSDCRSEKTSKHQKHSKNQKKSSTKKNSNGKSQSQNKNSKSKDTPPTHETSKSKAPDSGNRVATPSPHKKANVLRDPPPREGQMIITEDSEGDVHDINHNGSSSVIPDYKIGKKQHELLYTQIYRKQPNSDTYMVTKAKIDPISKSITQVENVEFMEEFGKSHEKHQLLQLCLSQLAKSEDRFSKLAQKNFRTCLQSK